MNACVQCRSTSAELRPYGPGGAPICFECAMATPDTKKRTEQEFRKRLDAAGPVAALTENGPVPMTGIFNFARPRRKRRGGR